MTQPDRCPVCQSNFQGEPIPPNQQANFGGETHWTRCIAIYSQERDRTVSWRCPDCGHEWPRS